MSTVTAAVTIHDLCESDVGGPLGHPPWPVWSAVDLSGIQRHLYCIHHGSFCPTVKRDILADLSVDVCYKTRSLQ